ncbi:hypothetical protein [Croceicoccus sp. Ery15]|uniref:hypothetical protein n=1 Tax=Croceicoccus sp. Ery15 TaxID=1703338 RepID=UPI001E56B3D6|nr:hypothetical protein [Croceicoccus sp. Ery15]
MGGDAPLLTGSALAVLGVVMLRWSWGRPRRATLPNLAGWASLAAAVICGAAAAGAWGIAVASLWAMGAACALLAWAGLTAAPPATNARRASDRRAGMLPQGDEPLRLGGRVLTFLLVAVLSMAASIAIALGMRWIALLCGTAEGNASVLALFAAPLAWTILAYALLMTASRKRQFAMIACSLLAVLPPVLTGIMV